MAAGQDEFRAALESGDLARVKKISAILFPHLPAPIDDKAAETQMHMARTQMDTITFKARAWSHRWLTERGLPSQLPDVLRPKAERIYPRIVEAVFVSANTNSAAMKPVAKLVQAAMCEAVEDCFANGDRDPRLVRSRMEEARRATFKKLIGTIGG